jgi:hypothetical protein
MTEYQNRILESRSLNSFKPIDSIISFKIKDFDLVDGNNNKIITY